MKKILCNFLFMCIVICAHSQNILQNVYARKIEYLNGQWQIIVDPFDAGYYDYRLKPSTDGFFKNKYPKSKSDFVEYDFSNAETLSVPGDWNTQNSHFFFYEGSIWYKKDFTYNKKANTKLFLYFGAVNYQANVYLNGKQLGTHIGGFTPFNYDITDKVKSGNNFVIVRVNNVRRPEGVPTVNSDWWNYGGITRDVMLVETPDTSIDDYLVQLSKGKYNEVSGFIKLNSPKEGVKVSLHIPELKINKTVLTDNEGIAPILVKARPHLWSPEDPKLYNVELICGDEKLEDLIGFRQIKTRGKSIYLNGKRVFFRGISIHEEAPFKQGRVTTEAECDTLLTWAKQLNCNFVRLAHYPHNEKMVRLAEKKGLMIWSETPVYWTIHWDDPDTYTNASAQLRDEMNRDKNRCAIVVW